MDAVTFAIRPNRVMLASTLLGHFSLRPSSSACANCSSSAAIKAAFFFGHFHIRFDRDSSFFGGKVRPLVDPRLCRFKGLYALLVSMPSIVDVTKAAKDATCFLFGSINPLVIFLDVAISFLVDAATLVTLPFISFSVCAIGLSGVTFVVSGVGSFLFPLVP
jgi:hypothetical protein